MLLTDARTAETKRKIQEAVEAGLKAKKVSARRASLDVVGNDGLIRDIRAGVMPSVDRLDALLDYLEVKGPISFSLPLMARLNREPSDRLSGVIEQVTVDGADYARIPLHDAKLSAGPGEMNEDATIIDHLAFRQDWLRKIDVKPENALMARIAGDSMAPAIQSGDLVMIDKTRRDVPAFKRTRLPQQLPIFAFRQDDQARVKRLERRSKEKLLVLYSDNPAILPEIVGEGDAHTLDILGQVVWSGHVWR